MIDKFLLTIFITSLSLIGVSAPKAIGQERPKCYLIDDSGELTDLTDICNVSQKRSPATDTTNEGENVVNNYINVVGSDSQKTGVSTNDSSVINADGFAVDSSSIDSSYFIDNEPGINYTAYVRRYTASPSSVDRLTRREQIFQFDDRNRNQTSILRQGRSELPFLIYRYSN